MYRSFVTCNDPNGVVECGTIRKSKTSSNKMEHRIERHVIHKSSGKSLALKAEEEEVSSKRAVENCHNPSFQLLEVSRGAQKLNQMIDSWSKGRNYEDRSKDIAKGLLKGALDLQESLVMLRKLQEATQNTAHFKKKDMEKLERGRIDEVRSERASSHRFRDQTYQMELQKPRLSADGSRDAIEELKKAIRDGLARQNLVSNKRNQEKTSFDWRKMESASDIPSTSSSQSSVVQSNSSYSSDSYVFQSAPEKKEKGVNLIAKLMGLEDIPSTQTLQKQSDVEKNLSQWRPNFDIETPGVWKAQPAAKMVDSEERTLKEVLETMHFKGLLKSSSVREIKSRSDQSTNSHARRRSVDDVLPIVVMKPQRVAGLQSEEPLEPSTWNEGGCDPKMTLRKMMVKEMLAPTLKQYKEQNLSAKKIQQRAEAEVALMKKIRQGEESKVHAKRVDKQEEKEVRTVVQKERPVDESNTLKKMRAEDTAAKRVRGEERTKEQREVVARVEDKDGKTKLRGSPKTKSPVQHQEQRKETSGKRVHKVEKVAVTSREAAEGKTAKPKSASTLQDQDKVTSFTKPRKPEKGSTTIVKNQSQHNNAPKTVSKHRAQTNIHSSKEKKKKEKPASGSVAAEQTIESLGCREVDKCIDMVVGNDAAPLSKETGTMLAEQASTEEEAITSEYQLEEHCRDHQSSLCNDTALTSECEKSIRSSEDANDHIDQIRRDASISKSRNPLKALLLNSSSFLTRAEEFFHLDTSCYNILPTTGICDSEETEPKLFLDYANELIEIRSHPDTKTRHSLLPTYMETSRTISVDELVDEVCNAVTSLGSYADFALNKLPSDCLYAILERDITCKGVVSGIWDLGWRHEFSVEDAEQAVNDLEKLLVSDLIEEVFA